MLKKLTKTQKTLLSYLALIVVAAIYIFVVAPNLNPLYSEGAFFWLVIITICALIPAIMNFKPTISINEKGKPSSFDLFGNAKPKKLIVIILGVLWGIFVLFYLIFNPLFFYKSYRDQMPEPTTKEFTSDVQAVDVKQIPIVDAELARTLADKKLGEKPSLGSQVRIGQPTLQNVNGELIWAVPLHHSGIFKWLANLEGAAGYIKVSATNMQKVDYEENYKIKIQPDSYLMDDLLRRVRLTNGLFTGITDYSFELNDEGKPFWVVTTYKNTCGFNLPEASGVIILDAQTGESTKYSLNQVPQWVDRVQPEDFILAQINNKGEYVHGIFNFSNRDKFRTSSGENIIYNNGRCYLFTGITSVGVDESTTGFWVVDMVTKEPTLYRMSGATEESAQQSAQGKVQDLGYYATSPIILNIFDTPTYFMTLKDSAKLIKKYAFVSIKDYVIVGVGDSVSEAKSDYAKALNQMASDAGIALPDDELVLTMVGSIDRINFTVSDDTTVYSFTLKEKPGVIFRVNLNASDKLPITQTGDSVQIKYILVEDRLMDVREFNNLTI